MENKRKSDQIPKQLKEKNPSFNKIVNRIDTGKANSISDLMNECD